MSSLLLLTLLLRAALAAPAPGETPAPASSQPVVLTTAPAPLRVELRPHDEQEAARLRATADAIQQALDNNPTGLPRAELLLRRANWLVSIDTEPYAGRYLLGVAEPDDYRRWADLLRRAEADLADARKIIDDAPEPTDELQESRLDDLRRVADLLTAFTGVLTGLSAERIDDPDALYAAAANLSPYLDDENRAISRAANLWQAVVLRRIGRPDRALDYLEPPLTPPGKAAIGLFTRWERLRCLAAGDRLAAALALAVRMEERCFAWFTDESLRDAAVSGCSLLRLQLYEQYCRQLADQGRDREAASCAKMIERIRSEHQAESGTITVARLRRVLPLQLEPEDPFAEPDDDAIDLQREPADEEADEEMDEGEPDEDEPEMDEAEPEADQPLMDEGGPADSDPQQPEDEPEDEHDDDDPGRL